MKIHKYYINSWHINLPIGVPRYGSVELSTNFLQIKPKNYTIDKYID